MGFLPGFSYMTGLDERLYLPRRTKPRTKVPAGSVAIALDQSVIYPVASPGGWNLIGQMALPLFDVRRSDPILLRAGDLIQFISINDHEFDKIAHDCRSGMIPANFEPQQIMS